MFLTAVLVAVLLLAWAWQSVHWYAPVEAVKIECTDSATPWKKGEPLKILSYNVQFMAGRNYYFFYDGGPDRRPSYESINWTIEQVAELIRKENPDIVLLQEVTDKEDSRTHYRDQVTELQQALARDAYPCSADAHYWKARFVPHHKILGAVSMKLTTLSRHPLDNASRHQLPIADSFFLKRRFYFQRAILETRLADDHGNSAAILNTHFDAWTGGSDLSAQQVEALQRKVTALENRNIPWIVGGDFNALPPDGGIQYRNLQYQKIDVYNSESELTPLFENYGAIPSLNALTSKTAPEWYTLYPNVPGANKPDRTIDYFFYSSDWRAEKSAVLRGKALHISDHLPLITSFTLKTNSSAFD